MSLVYEKVWERMKARYFSLCCLRMIVRVNVVQTPVVHKMDSTIQWVSMRKINCAIQWIEIYPMDSDKLIHLFKQLGPGQQRFGFIN